MVHHEVRGGNGWYEGTIDWKTGKCWSLRMIRKSIGSWGAYVELAGFRYVAAFDGRQALKHAREQKPWAIVLDLMLPDVSGWEVFHRDQGGCRHA